MDNGITKQELLDRGWTEEEIERLLAPTARTRPYNDLIDTFDPEKKDVTVYSRRYATIYNIYARNPDRNVPTIPPYNDEI